MKRGRRGHKLDKRTFVISILFLSIFLALILLETGLLSIKGGKRYSGMTGRTIIELATSSSNSSRMFLIFTLLFLRQFTQPIRA
jgi:hypothetical protein